MEKRLRVYCTCGSTDLTQIWKDCKGKGRSINEIDHTTGAEDHGSVMEFQEYENSWSSQDSDQSDHNIDMIEIEHGLEQRKEELQAEAEVPHIWDKKQSVQHV